MRDLLTSLVSCGSVTDQILQTVEIDEDLTEVRLVDRTRKLAGLLEYLRGYAVGQARRGEQARRTHREPDTLNGDDTLASHIDPLAGCECPEDGECVCSLDKSRDRREYLALNRALASGGVNTAASWLLTEMNYSLGSWAKGIAKAHRITLQWKTTTGYAHFLAQNVPKIALDPDAGHFHHRVRAFVRRAEKIINPPEAPERVCGPCPTPVETEHGRTLCATPLTADRAATEVICPQCKETHRVDDLIDRLWNDVDEWHLTRHEILALVEVLERPVSVDTFKTWCHRGKKIGDPPVLQRLHPRGYRRPGEAVGEWHALRNSPGDKPVYRLIDLRKFMTDGKRSTVSA
ncbi:hypothetical protein [Mycobacterium sp. SMC-4]|uniref:hypothetical protein n=1 Tax=Mycobacterium sp. SMC-4 TaxID=2857059 RepID=UPI0021B31E19|nr:hypothetical protein [Mycobacterium sp. SMC-4]UXA19526.1 hypothetical protein KXD98_07975 [Mycobacterium sp. SMC-4]